MIYIGCTDREKRNSRNRKKRNGKKRQGRICMKGMRRPESALRNGRRTSSRLMIKRSMMNS
jgi:hypothetical protein